MRGLSGCPPDRKEAGDSGRDLVRGRASRCNPTGEEAAERRKDHRRAASGHG